MHNASVTRDNFPAPVYQHQCCIALKHYRYLKRRKERVPKDKRKQRKRSLMWIIQSCHDGSARCRIKDIRVKVDKKEILKDRRRPTPRQMPHQYTFSETVRWCNCANIAQRFLRPERLPVVLVERLFRHPLTKIVSRYTEGGGGVTRPEECAVRTNMQNTVWAVLELA